LPANDTNLATGFTAQDYADVLTNNEVRVDQSTNGQFAVFLFKDKYSGTDTIAATWEGQSTLAPSSSTVYLQVYNKNSTTWETIASNNTESANTDFFLKGTVTSNLSDYFDANFWISCRVYQEAV
jgi:hypothetical protein